MRLSIIAAVADNGVIGLDNALPWHLPADLKRFKRLTVGHHLLLGRRTWKAIGQPLPGRTMVVISRGEPRLPEGVRIASSLDAAIEIAAAAGDDEAFVAGGAQIYALALPRADRMYLTRIHASPAGDTYFPDFTDSDWTTIERQDHAADRSHVYSYSFIVLDRICG